tara:strand:+ start:6811 stop:8064 length:1254 start_codon:yes stop_codon:yes gene_type:complete
MINSQYVTAILLIISATLLSACDTSVLNMGGNSEDGHAEPAADYMRGEHGGRILTDGDITLELAIFETGVPPEFRAWLTTGGEAIDPTEVDLHIRLIRLGDRVDEINFKPENDFLRGDMVVYEPHSFIVSIEAGVRGEIHRWEYDNFEGRTRIESKVAEAFGLETEIAGPANIVDTVEVFGQIVPVTERQSVVSARFDGEIKSVRVATGASVKAGQTLATVESNESLNSYSIAAPIDGVVTERDANPGEQTNGRNLFTIMDTSTVWADLSLFPTHRLRVKVGDPVSLSTASGEITANGSIARIKVVADSNQAATARVVLDNANGLFLPGMYVTAKIKVAEYPVPLAVKRSGLQGFRDFTVVYAKIGEEYEVRMLELGRQDANAVEVLGGLEPGTRYVTTNSYLVKADIEKSGASHDH